MQRSPIRVIADPAGCSLQFDPVGKARFVSSCDIAKSSLAAAGISYDNQAAAAGRLAEVRIGLNNVPSVDGRGLSAPMLKAAQEAFQARLRVALSAAGYPEKADPTRVNFPLMFMILMSMILCATALYGPLAAALVELFPARIRYTALSLPYNIGTGLFGGFLPATAFAIVAATGNIYSGLWYSVTAALLAAAVTLFFLPETRGR